MPKFLWTQRSNFGPSPRAFQGTAYDSNRRRVVLFGGSRNQPGTFFGDTWEWDGSYWTQMDDIGPAPRSGHAMSYDSNRRVTLLFGGTSVGANAAGANANDTWQWDGEEWTQLADSGPSARFSHAMAFDPGRKSTVLFGGNSSVGPGGNLSFLQDTWEFGGEDWTQKEDVGPAARGSHVMAYDATGKRVVLFGGHPARSDTWAWDGKTWTQLSEFGPPGRENAGMAGLPDAMVLFGGSGAANVLGDSWQFDGKLWTQRQDIGPGPRLGHALVFDSDRNRVVLFGGSSKNEGNDPSALLADTWEHQADQPLPPVSVASLQFTPNKGGPGDVVVATLTLTRSSPTPTPIQMGITSPASGVLPTVTFPAYATSYGADVTVPLFDTPFDVLLTVSAQIAGTPQVRLYSTI